MVYIEADQRFDPWEWMGTLWTAVFIVWTKGNMKDKLRASP